jgi:hypothetical protein
MVAFPFDQLVLNFHDAILYGSDVSLVESPSAWLNDACIHFYMTVLQQQHPAVMFVDPSVVTFLMHQCDEEDLEEFSARFDKGREKYCVPINNGHASSAAWKRPCGGSHWSLLLVIGDLYWHFDSVKGGNSPAARAVAKVFSNILGHDESGKVIEVTTPQQHNSYDCGLHALAAAEVLARSELGASERAEEALINAKLGRPGFGPEMRRKIRDKVEEIAKQYRTTL